MSKVADVLAELRLEQERLTAELARIGRAIEALEEVANPSAARAESSEGEISPVPLPAVERPYAMLDLYSATVAYLRTVDTPQTSTQIANALRAGGFKTRSARFTATVRTMLLRDAARLTGISITRDHKRWFVRRKK
jgi:hypothetical protein